MNPKKKKRIKAELASEYGVRCWWNCSVADQFSFEQLTIDHLRPTSKGGSDSPENLRLACKQCNQSRGDSLFPPQQRYRSSSLNGCSN